MGGRLDSLLGSHSIQESIFLPIIRPKIPTQSFHCGPLFPLLHGF
jgi:hypothetical protein